MLNRQKTSTTASAAAYTQPPLADWRNRKKNDTLRTTAMGPDPVIRRNRKLKYLELFFFAVVISLIIGVDLSIFSINKRLNALEGEFVEVKDWAFPASLLESKYASLNTRVRALTEALNGLDAKLNSVSPQQTATDAAGDETMAVTEVGIPSEAPAAGIAQLPADIASGTAEFAGTVSRPDEGTSSTTQQLAMLSGFADDATGALQSTGQKPAKPFNGNPAIPAVTPASATDANLPQGSAPEGPWVINLLSDPNEALAERFAARARDRGVPVEQSHTEVNGRVFWRVQITGFGTMSEAQTHAQEVKEKLQLKDIWIFKQQG